MEIKTFNVAGKTFTFVCESKNTRNGFKHECSLFINNYHSFDGVCYYLNRTWEKYRYQSVMLRAVANMRDYYADCIKCEFMHENNYTRLTAKRRGELNAVIDNHAGIKMCDDLRELILNA